MNRLKQYVLVIAGLLALGGNAYAQTAVTATTLAAAVTTTSANTITVASATGITAGSTVLYIDAELMNVRTVSGTSIGVTRGTNSTASTPHLTGAPVLIGPTGAGPFITNDRVGACTATNEAYLPQYNVRNGKMFDCTGSIWSEIGGPNGIYTTIILCGDLANNTTSYAGPISGYPGGILYDGTLTASDLSYSTAGTGCDAMDNTTEATADLPLFANNAFHVLGMACTVGSAGSNGLTINLRSAAANLTPNVTMTIATALTSGAVSQRTSTRIAAGATFAIRDITTEDLSASNGWCQVRIQILP